MTSFHLYSTASNVADDGKDDGRSDKGETQNTEVEDSQILDEMEDNQSSVGTSSQSSNWVTTPIPGIPLKRPIPGKQMRYTTKKDCIEDILLQIIEKKTEHKQDKDDMFCLSFAATL